MLVGGCGYLDTRQRFLKMWPTNTHTFCPINNKHKLNLAQWRSVIVIGKWEGVLLIFNQPFLVYFYIIFVSNCVGKLQMICSHKGVVQRTESKLFSYFLLEQLSLQIALRSKFTKPAKATWKYCGYILDVHRLNVNVALKGISMSYF